MDIWDIDFASVTLESLYKKIFELSGVSIVADNDFLWSLYKKLLHHRHDLLHYFVVNMLGIKFEQEKRLKHFFDFDNKLFEKTPDIYCQKDNIHYIIDVSVTSDFHKTESQKLKKYNPIVIFLKNEGIDCEYIHINVNMNRSNLEKELSKLLCLKVAEFLYNDYAQLTHCLAKIIQNVCGKMDRTFFDCKLAEFLEINENDENIYVDDSRFRMVGKYIDLDVDPNVYNKYFNENKHVYDRTVGSFDFVYNDEDIAKDLKDIIENNDKLTKKYMDNKLKESDFMEFESEIRRKVKTMNKYKNCKPTHHVMVNLECSESFVEKNGNLCEETQVIDFIKEFNMANLENISNKFVMLKDIAKTFVSMCPDPQVLDSRIFSDGVDIVADQISGSTKTREAIKILRAIANKTKPNKSDLISVGICDPGLSTDEIKQIIYTKYNIKKDFDVRNGFINYIYGQSSKIDIKKVSHVRDKRTIRIHQSMFNNLSKREIEKNGIQLKKKEYSDDDENQLTIDFENIGIVDNLLDFWSKDTSHTSTYKEIEYMLNNYSMDHPQATSMKGKHIKKYKKQLNLISGTNAFHYSRSQQIVLRELFHFSQLKHKTHTYSFITGGLKNTLIILANCYLDNQNAIGKPFLCVVRTRKPELYRHFFGQTYESKIRGTDYYYVMTNWRRLSLTKLTYLCDVHTSVLSSTMNSVLSNPTNYKDEKYIKDIFTTRVLIGYTTSQKTAEFLMDNRYAYMSVFSLYTNIKKLMLEKFKPPYKNLFQTWFLNKIFNRFPVIHNSMKNGGVVLSDIVLLHNKRDPSQIGGKINLPSFYHNGFNNNVFELMDEIFVYVHTMKEPSNLFHESIKALKTIIQYQKEFDELPMFIKRGDIFSKDHLLEYLLYDTKIGFSKAVIMNSVKHTINIESPDFKKIMHEINSEHVSELLSTKAVISDVDRLVVQNNDERKSKKKKRKEEIKREMLIKRTNETIPEIKTNYIHKSKTNYYNPNKSRQKVFETILDEITNDSNCSKTINMAENHVKLGGKVLADICIKSQYGSKREFYVININAKASARITELFFRKLCEKSPNEAISIPGDKKIIKMQEMVDKISHNFQDKNQKLLFINGDCTKWSAAETMGSFLAMVEALKSHIGLNCYMQLKSTFLSWADKDIQVPLDVINKVYPTKKYDTMFLNNILETKRIKSTQNFLQGMFNYASSYKAVCCMNYVSKIWKLMYPDSKLIFEHMEHSDDYVNVVIYSNDAEIERFRIFQKIMMRLHGYNDSERKTSCQPFFMEFVSLISFNGVMLYPQIKKAKECNLNLPCVGYKQDIDSALSRVKECSRIGCNQTFLYFYQKLHVYIVGKAYSILPGMKNAMGRDWIRICNTPTELFGLPDPLPLFSLYCKGNVNNYRLYKYGDDDSRKMLYYLYLLTCKYDGADFNQFNLAEYGHSLHTPKCVYTSNTKTLRRLRKALKINTQEIREFWENNVTYHIVKPNNVSDLKKWIKCMFFNRSFVEAYSKQSRAIMTMRLSKVVNGRNFKDVEDANFFEGKLVEYMKDAYTLKEYFEKHDNEYKKHTLQDYEIFLKKNDNNKIKNLFEKILLNSDVTPTFIYSYLNTISSIENVALKDNNIVQTSKLTPYKFKVLDIHNDPGILLQFLLNNNNFIKDNRKVFSPESLLADCEILKKRYDLDDLKKIGVVELLAIFNDLCLSKDKRIVTFGYDRSEKNLEDTVTEILKFNNYPGKICEINTRGVINVYDPYSKTLLYTRGKRISIDYHSQCVENIMLLYVFFVLRYNLTITAFKNILGNLEFKLYNRLDEDTDDEYKLTDYKTILSNINDQTFKTFNYDLNQKKIVSFLKATLLDDYDLMDDLLNSQYVFSYKYIQTAKIISNKYIGLTIISCTYYKTDFLVYYNNEVYDKPILLINGFCENIIQMYNIALRLVQCLTEDELENTLCQNRITRVNYKFLKKIIPSVYLGDMNYVLYDLGDKKYKKIINMKVENVAIYPIIVVTEGLEKTFKTKHKLMRTMCRVDFETLTVMIGDKKMFSVPIWECRHHDNMIWNGLDVMYNINIKTLLKNKVLENYLFNGYVGGQYKSTIDEKDMSNHLLNNIKYEKLYKTNFMDIKDYYFQKEEIKVMIPEPVMNKIFATRLNKVIDYKNFRFLENENKKLEQDRQDRVDQKIKKLKTKFLEEHERREKVEVMSKANEESKNELKRFENKVCVKEYDQNYFYSYENRIIPYFVLFYLLEKKMLGNFEHIVEDFVLNSKIFKKYYWSFVSIQTETILHIRDLFEQHTRMLLGTTNLRKISLQYREVFELKETISKKTNVFQLADLMNIYKELKNDKNNESIINDTPDIEFLNKQTDMIDNFEDDFFGFVYEGDDVDLTNWGRGYQITANNVFVNDPASTTKSLKEKKKKKEVEERRYGYRVNLLKRILQTPDINVIDYLHGAETTKKNMNYYEFVYVFLDALKALNACYTEKEFEKEMKTPVLLLYHLQCHTYINNGFKIEDEEKLIKYRYTGDKFLMIGGIEFDWEYDDDFQSLGSVFEDDEIIVSDISYNDDGKLVLWFLIEFDKGIGAYDKEMADYGYGLIKDIRLLIMRFKQWQNRNKRRKTDKFKLISKIKRGDSKKEVELKEIEKKEIIETNLEKSSNVSGLSISGDFKNILLGAIIEEETEAEQDENDNDFMFF